MGIGVLYPEDLGSLAKLERVVDAYGGSSWPDLVRILDSDGVVPDDAAAAHRWAKRRIDRHHRFYAMFRSRAEEHWQAPRRDLAVEIGCGRGDGLPALARDFDRVVGFDPNLAALIAARKLLEEQGIDNVTLVQGSAHAMPVAENSVAYLQAINVIEHVYRPVHFFEEAKRVLASGGIFCGDSRNRFDPFFPEPHVNLMWVGFLPRRYMEPYVRMRRGIGYGGKYLLSCRQLRDAVERSFGGSFRIVLPDIEAYWPGAPEPVRRLIERIHGKEPLERAALYGFPTHIALARA